EEAPDSFDRFDIPKESLIDPFFRGPDCTVSHTEVAVYCYEVIRCPISAVPEYDMVQESYVDEAGEYRAKILWWTYLIAGEVYRFELNEEKKLYERK
ncbi:hypothetical protein LCGC14_2579720, partial [marine sediment metagenome]